MKFRIVAVFLLAFAAGCAEAPRVVPTHAASATSPAPAAATARIAQTANPLATHAAMEMLDRGGNAIDAIVAAQMVLGLVEPQMSGPGGGTLLIYWDASHRKLVSFDGLAAAPGRTTASLRTALDGHLLPRAAVYTGGRSVAVPGTLPMLAEVHRRYGKLPWPVLFEPAIALAGQGFPLPEFLHRIVELDHVDPRATPDLAMYFDAAGHPLPVGTIIRNPQYAETLRRIAAHGVDGLLGDGGAARIVASAQRGPLPSLMTAEDLRAYRPVEREPICAPFLDYRVCTVPPPSYGGIYLLQVLQMMQSRSAGRYDFDDPRFVHLFVEAGRLARADRAKYVGDPAFTPVPTEGLIAREYVHERAASIDASAANAHPRAGLPAGANVALASTQPLMMGGTSQLTAADASGDVVAMTTTNNLGFGSRLMVGGYVLNDALTNFSAAPHPGEHAANEMAPHKRPFTSMAPAIVFDASGKPFAAGGSAGGGPIPDYIGQGWIEMLANHATPAQAIVMGHVSTATIGKIVVEQGTAAEGLAGPLRALGHDVVVAPLLSGAGYIERSSGGWIGAADPRRGGDVQGD
ncbi:MAG TPA: gamma-glutamyltransferase family protein [Usitatibacter sp.]|nr:gamma-glutamyltransferase family protein [Usitatibacter sp.]